MQITLSSYSALSRLLGEQTLSASQTASEEQTPLQQALQAMTSAMEEDAEDRKARAQQRLDDAKEQLDYLRRWGFDPKVVAEQATALGESVSAAARDFTAALSDTGVTTNAASAGGNDVAAKSEAETADNGTANAGTNEAFTSAERAYRDIMKETGGILSSADRSTLDEFKAVAQEIKSLLEEAIRKLQQQKAADKTAVSGAQSAADGLANVIGSLGATASFAGSASPSVSISLTL